MTERNRTTRATVPGIAALILLGFSSTVSAITLTWMGTTTSEENWNTASNWCPPILFCGINGTPDFGDDVVLTDFWPGGSGPYGVTVWRESLTPPYGGNVNAEADTLSLNGLLTVRDPGSLEITGSISINGGKLVNGHFNSTTSLYVGYFGPGAYELGCFGCSTGGTLHAGNIYVGFFDYGSFTHDFGVNNIEGTLYVAFSADIAGVPYYQMDSGTLASTDEIIGFQGHGKFIQRSVPFHNPPSNNTVSNNLILGHEESGFGEYELDPEVAGAALTVNNETIGLAGTGDFVHRGGIHTVTGDLTLASAPLSAGYYLLEGDGVLSAMNQTHGAAGDATFLQFGATSNSVTGNLTLGMVEGSYGNYRLFDGNLSAARASVGANGFGVFQQEGGSNTVTGDLWLGESTDAARGIYTLSDGVLLAANEFVGGYGRGTFTQSGGTNDVSGRLTVGFCITADPSVYTLNGGVLSAQWEVINRCVAHASFVHNDGSNTTGQLVMAEYGGTAAYDLHDGTLNVATDAQVGRVGVGTFVQHGGTHTVATLDIENNGSSYALQGGVLRANEILLNGGTAFGFAGGELSTGDYYGSLVNQGGTFSPGDPFGNTTVTGNYTQLAAAVLELEYDATGTVEFDTVAVYGTAQLGGTVQLRYPADAFSTTTSFDVLTAQTISGSFAALAVPDRPAEGALWSIDLLVDEVGSTDVLRLTYNADSDSDGIADDQDNCTLVANADQYDSNGDQIGSLCDADITGPGDVEDCVVNFLDLQAVKTAFFSSPTSPNWNPVADFDNSGSINFADLQVVKRQLFGAPGPSAAGCN